MYLYPNDTPTPVALSPWPFTKPETSKKRFRFAAGFGSVFWQCCRCCCVVVFSYIFSSTIDSIVNSLYIFDVADSLYILFCVQCFGI